MKKKKTIKPSAGSAGSTGSAMKKRAISNGGDLNAFLDTHTSPDSLSRVLVLEERLRAMERELISTRTDCDRQLVTAQMTIMQLQDDLNETLEVNKELKEKNDALDRDMVMQQMDMEMLNDEAPAVPAAVQDDPFRLVLFRVFKSIEALADTNENGEDVKNFFKEFFQLVSSPRIPSMETYARELLLAPTALDFYDEAHSYLKSNAQDAIERNEKLSNIARRMKDDYKQLQDLYEDACEKNKVLVLEHELMTTHTKETDSLFNAAADTIDQLKLENRELVLESDNLKKQLSETSKELEDTYKEMEEAERIFKVLETRLAWKTKADEQGCGEDAKKLTRLMAGLRREKETYQTAARQTKNTADGLAIRVKTMRDEMDSMRKKLALALSKIPAPRALIKVQEIEETIELEIAECRRAMFHDKSLRDPRITNPSNEVSININPDKCPNCAVLWLAKDYFERECDTMRMKIAQIQDTYAKKTDKKEKEVEERIQNGLREANNDRVMYNQRERKRNEEMEEAKRALTESQATIDEMKKANDRRTQARKEELEQAQKDSYAAGVAKTREEDKEIVGCCRYALSIINGFVLFAEKYVTDEEDISILRRYSETTSELNARHLAGTTTMTLLDARDHELYGILYAIMGEFPLEFDGYCSTLIRAINRSFSIDSATKASAAGYSGGGVDPKIHDATYELLVDVLRPILLMISSVVSVDEWRIKEDKDMLTSRFNTLEKEMDILQLHGDNSKKGLNLEIIGSLRSALFDPILSPEAPPFITWIVELAVGCMGTADYLANAMKKSLCATRAARDELVVCNQKMIKDIEKNVYQLMQSFQSSSSSLETSLHVLVRNDSAMLNALINAVNGAANPLKDAMASSSTPPGLRSAINSLQLAWGFLKKLCESPQAKISMHPPSHRPSSSQSYDDRRKRLCTSDITTTTAANNYQEDDYVRHDSPFYEPGK